MNHKKEHQKIELIIIGSVLGTVLLVKVNVIWWELTDVGTLGNESVFY